MFYLEELLLWNDYTKRSSYQISTVQLLTYLPKYSYDFIRS